MRSCLNKTFLWGCVLLFLKSGYGATQPIQLVPHNRSSANTITPLPSLPSQTMTGFWEGTPPSIIETHFSKLPIHLTSATLRNLREQVVKEKYTPLLKNPSYEKILFSLLIEGGEWDQGKELISESNLPEKENLLLNLLWVQGDSKRACEKITNLIRTSPTLELKQQNIYCLYINGETERGKVATELLGETNPEASLLLSALFDPSLEPSFDSSLLTFPFLLTLWCTTGRDIPKESIDKMAPSFLALVTRSEKVPFKTRLLASEMALDEGIIKAEVVLDLLKESSHEGLLKTFAQELPSAKPETLLPLLERASQEEKLRLVGKIFAPLLSKISLSEENLALAPYMIRAYFEAGNNDLAQKWGTLFMREAPEEAISILPLLHLAFPQNKWTDTQIKAWQAYQTRTHPETAAQNSYTLRHILEALGELSEPPLEGEPHPPSWRQEQALFDKEDLALLDSAAQSKRKGEVLLLTLTIIGDMPLKDLPVDKFVHLLKNLYKAGYTDEARSLALEFLIAKGF